jgi:hypothetical protein
MEQRRCAEIMLDSDDDDELANNEKKTEQDVTKTIEQFVRARHVQTLKYLRRVIDENRQLRLHIEHLKSERNESHPNKSSDIDTINSKDECPMETTMNMPIEVC